MGPEGGRERDRGDPTVTVVGEVSALTIYVVGVR